MENKVTLVAQRVKEGIKVLPGSKLYSCSQCERAVWVAPSGLDELGKGADIICADCFFSKKVVKFEEIAEITEEQLDELERMLGYRPSKDEVMRKFKDFFEKRDKRKS